VQLSALPPGASSEDLPEHREGLRWVELTSAAWRVRFALRDLRENHDIEQEGRFALAATDPVNLRLLAERLLTQKDVASHSDFEERGEAAAAMAWMAFLLERSPHEIVTPNKGLGR
jgi:hypothetical protein